jgi:hypothetical protein
VADRAFHPLGRPTTGETSRLPSSPVKGPRQMCHDSVGLLSFLVLFCIVSIAISHCSHALLVTSVHSTTPDTYVACHIVQCPPYSACPIFFYRALVLVFRSVLLCTRSRASAFPCPSVVQRSRFAFFLSDQLFGYLFEVALRFCFMYSTLGDGINYFSCIPS